MLLQNLLFVAIGLVGLFFGGNWLVTGASRVAVVLRVSPLVIGLTIVAIGTSAPELVVSVIAATQGSEGLALGNVVGSNIANIGLILGLTGVMRAVHVQESLVKREIPLMLVVSIFATILILDGRLTRLDGILLISGFIAFNALFYYLVKNSPEQEPDPENDVSTGEDDLQGDPNKIKLGLEAARIVGGSIVLVVGAQLLVIGATELARSVGISEVVIGVTMVAFGTSLPELATSLMAALRGQNDIAVGNVIGSNIANLLLVLGSTAFISTIDVLNETELTVVEYGMMLLFSFLLLPFARNRVLSRRESALFLGLYIAFIFYTFAFAPGGLSG